MPEISHVRIAVPEQGILNRILREGGAQLFPQWLYAEPGAEPRILWWGIRGALATPDAEEAGAEDSGSVEDDDVASGDQLFEIAELPVRYLIG